LQLSYHFYYYEKHGIYIRRGLKHGSINLGQGQKAAYRDGHNAGLWHDARRMVGYVYHTARQINFFPFILLSIIIWSRTEK